MMVVDYCIPEFLLFEEKLMRANFRRSTEPIQVRTHEVLCQLLRLRDREPCFDRFLTHLETIVSRAAVMFFSEPKSISALFDYALLTDPYSKCHRILCYYRFNGEQMVQDCFCGRPVIPFLDDRKEE